jgi:hypothetical protein
MPVVRKLPPIDRWLQALSSSVLTTGEAVSYWNSFRILVMIFSAAAMALAIPGCGGSSGIAQSGSDPKEAEHLRHASSLVFQYTLAAKKQPTKMDEVKDWAVKEGKGTAEDFASTRDKELYVIDRSGQGLGLREQTGKNGKCYVLRMGAVSEVPVADAERTIGDSNRIQKRMKGRG